MSSGQRKTKQRPDEGAIVASVEQKSKKQKLGYTESTALAVSGKPAVGEDPHRTSSLLAPTMLLTGHVDQVFCVRFNERGDALASGSHDKRIFLWKTYGECENYNVLTGHKNAVLQLQWSPDGEHLVSCSPDTSVRSWDALTGEQIGIMKDHKGIVNCCAMRRLGSPLVVSGSDDCCAKVWDMRATRASQTLEASGGYQITAIDISDEMVYTGGIDNVVKVWDLRKENEVVMTMEGHTDTITGMEISPTGTHLLTNSMDNTMRSWDIRPFAPENRCVRVFTGHQHGFEKTLLRCSWSADGKHVSGGSSDRMVHIWNVASGEIVYSLPGHDGSVNDVAFHPEQPIVVSASSDKTLYLGELLM